MPYRPFSVYEVECLCGKPVQCAGSTGTCGECGREVRLETWQVQRTITAQGLLVDSDSGKDKPK